MSAPPIDSGITGIQLREEVLPGDEAQVRRLVAATGYFRPDEVEIAAELIRERQANGLRSGYRFLIAETSEDRRILGYSCFGAIPCSVGSYDLYWIAVDPSQQRRGLGRRLVRATEAAVLGLGGRRLYIETSSRSLYRATQEFYRSCGYRLEAELADFYDVGDGKQIYVKVLAG